MLAVLSHTDVFVMDECTRTALGEVVRSPSCVSLPDVLPWRDCPNICFDALRMTVRTSDRSPREATLEDKSSWLSKLQQIPCEDRQLCKLSTVHTDFECTMHHQETNYAHHTHYLHSHHHHRHHHHHHHQQQRHHSEERNSDGPPTHRALPETLTRHIQGKLRQSRLQEVQTYLFTSHLSSGVDSTKSADGLGPDSPSQLVTSPHSQNCINSHSNGNHNNRHHHSHNHHIHHHHGHHQLARDPLQSETNNFPPSTELSSLTENGLAKLSIKAVGSQEMDLPSPTPSRSDVAGDGTIPLVNSASNVSSPPDSWNAIQNRVIDWLNGVKETDEVEHDSHHGSILTPAVPPEPLMATNTNQPSGKT